MSAMQRLRPVTDGTSTVVMGPVADIQNMEYTTVFDTTSDAEIAAIEAELSFTFPQSYKDFLNSGDATFRDGLNNS